jgi:hypothetical protein
MRDPTGGSPKAPRALIVLVWAWIFGFLGHLSLFSIIRKAVPKARKSYLFVEVYVTMMTLLSIIALAVATWRRAEQVNVILVFVAAFGAYRIYEIVVYQVNVLLFDEYRAKRASQPYYVRGYRRIVLLLLHNYLEVVCWLGVGYMYFVRAGDITLEQGVSHLNFIRVFRESLLLMFSFNANVASPKTSAGVIAFSVHAIVGLFMTIMVFARFLSVLPAPKTIDEFEQDN